jgi:spore coat polysaccharide biosynthesis protein SpsF
MGSNRLPGKVLADIGGRPLLALLLERVTEARTIAGVAVATTTDAADDPVAALCEDLGVTVVRGHPTDVLDRFAQAARGLSAGAIARISADSPLIDAPTVDAVVAAYAEGSPDIAQNHRPQDWPFGTAVEVVSRDCLDRLDAEVSDPRLREHVTLYAYESPDAAFQILHVPPPPELGTGEVNVCVDTPEDLERVRALWRAADDPHTPLVELVTRAAA